jgi:hypothetical protein
MAAEITTKHLFTMRLETGAPQQVGQTPGGRRMVVPVLGGTFEGERLSGTVDPGGSDWITIRTDGAFSLDVRLVLRAKDGALIGLTYRGLRHGPAEVLAKLARGETVPSSEYYFRAAMAFETASETYDWINRIVAIGTGERLPTGPVYTIFEVL